MYSDSLIGDTAVLEIKCPFSIQDTNGLSTAVDSKKVYRKLINLI